MSNVTAPVLRRSCVMEVRELDNSTHFYYAPTEKEGVREEFTNWIKKVDR